MDIMTRENIESKYELQNLRHFFARDKHTLLPLGPAQLDDGQDHRYVVQDTGRRCSEGCNSNSCIIHMHHTAKGWFVCLFVCGFTDSGSRRSVALLREELALPEGSRPSRAGRRAVFVRRIPTPPLVGR